MAVVVTVVLPVGHRAGFPFRGPAKYPSFEKV
jgi:hypothetical protein